MKRHDEDIKFYQNIANVASYFFGWTDFVMFDTILGTSPKGDKYARVPWYTFDAERLVEFLQVLADKELYPNMGWSGRNTNSPLPDLGLPSGWMFLLNRPEGGDIEGFAPKLKDAVSECISKYLNHINFKDVEVKFLRDK